MARILDDSIPVAMGNCIRVYNEEKAHAINLQHQEDIYVCIQVENAKGNEEYPILLTQDEFAALKIDTEKDGSGMKAGRIYPISMNKQNMYQVKLKDVSGKEFVVNIPIMQWKIFFDRAVRHPHSVTRKRFLTDLLD